MSYVGDIHRVGCLAGTQPKQWDGMEFKVKSIRDPLWALMAAVVCTQLLLFGGEMLTDTRSKKFAFLRAGLFHWSKSYVGTVSCGRSPTGPCRAPLQTLKMIYPLSAHGKC